MTPREAAESGNLLWEEDRVQGLCLCAACYDGDDYLCEDRHWESTGPCRRKPCSHHGTPDRYGLCEACFAALAMTHPASGDHPFTPEKPRP